jgi:hypothetical protein
MAEDQITDRPHDAPAVMRQPREVRVVESNNPVMDTAGFEHLIRVARVMAESGMMSKTLTHEKQNGNEVALPGEVVLARAFIISELAARINESPMSVMQCASFVHGKLMLEGKFVDAMLETKFGIKTQKQFGTWDPVTETTILGEEGKGDMLGIVVSGTVDGRREEIHGSVGSWKTTGTGSPWKPGNMKKMLGNRGVREFARAHQAGAILGIIGIVADDEIEDTNTTDWDAGLSSAPRRRVKADLQAKLASPKTVEPHDPNTGEVIDNTVNVGGMKADEVKANLDAAAASARPTETDGVQSAETEQDTSGSATDASEGSQESMESTRSSSDDKSSGGGEDPETSRQEVARQVSTVEQKDPDDFPGDRQPGAAAAEAPKRPTDTLPAFWFDVPEGSPWITVKKHLGAVYKSDDWSALEAEDQAAFRAKVWELRGEGKVDFAADPSAFRCWMATQVGDAGADAVEGNFKVLKGEPIFKRMSDDQQNTMENAVKATCALLRIK